MVQERQSFVTDFSWTLTGGLRFQMESKSDIRQKNVPTNLLIGGNEIPLADHCPTGDFHYFKTSLEITIFWISEVPSPMVQSLASR